jgi:hypothetical protein
MKPLFVTESNRSFLLLICAELGNRELEKFIVANSLGDISIANVVEQLGLLEGNCEDISGEISFAVSHFFALSSSDLSSLSFTAFAAVIRDASLRLSSEGSLFEIIYARMRSTSDSRFSGFLQFIRFEFLSCGCFAKFFDLICDRFDELNVLHWESLRGRLLLPPSGPVVETFPFRLWSPLDGIISHLTATFGGNVHDNGPNNAAKNVADLGINSYFESANGAKQSICFKFKKMTITSTHYSIGRTTALT